MVKGASDARLPRFVAAWRQSAKQPHYGSRGEVRDSRNAPVRGKPFTKAAHLTRRSSLVLVGERNS